MEDKTITDGASVDNGGTQQPEPQIINGVAVDDQGQAIPLPEETDAQPTAAPATSEEPSAEQQPDTQGAEALPDVDDKLQKYAQSHGIELDSPSAIKAAKIALENQQEFSRNRQKESEIEKSMVQMSDESAEAQAQATGENPEVLKRIQRMEVKNSINEFWTANPDAKQYEEQMTDIAVSSGLYGTPEAILKASYAIAKSQDSDNLLNQGKREALETLASKQQASVPRGNAVTTAPSNEAAITPQNVDQMVGSHDLEWYKKNREAINRAMAG